MSRDTTMVRTRKNKENPYVMLDKTGLYDNRLSWKAKGLHAYLMSLPDDWTIYISELTKHAKDGRDATRAAFKELELAGYITNEAIRNEKGRIEKWEKIVYEQPLHRDEFEMPKKKKKDKSPDTENPDLDIPHLENPTLLINDLTNKKNELNNDLTNNNKVVPKKISPSKKSTIISNDTISSVVVVEVLSKYDLKPNLKTLTKWSTLANDITICKAVEDAIRNPRVKNVIGYVTRMLEQGYTPPVPGSAPDQKKDILPEWIEKQGYPQFTDTPKEELTDEQKRQAEELLRALGEIQ